MNRRSFTSTKVFVGSLPPNVTAENLRKLFSPYGVISECDIANRCGFLHIEDKNLAMKAIEELNNTEFMGSRISVEMGRPKTHRGNRLPSRDGGGKMIGGINSMGRANRPYYSESSTEPTRSRDFEPNFYHDANSEFSPIRNHDYTYNSYNDHLDCMGMSLNPSVTYNRCYTMEDHHAALSYQLNGNDSGYLMDGGAIGSCRSIGGLHDNCGMIGSGGGNAMYDNREHGNMYNEHRAPVMGERRSVIMDQGMAQSECMDNYGMEYTRRDFVQPKQLIFNDGYSDRAYGSSHLTAGGYPAYSMSQKNDSGYQMSPSGAYGDSRHMSSAYSNYPPHHGFSSAGRAYESSHDNYVSSNPQTEYGDSHGQHPYETEYAEMQHRRDGYAVTYEQPSNYHY